MDISCSLGLSCCDPFIDYTKQVGELISWQEVIAIGGIIFAASQFMEAVKLRNYIYRFGWLHKATPILVGVAIIAVVIANFIQLTNTRVPYVSYPAFYEIIALVALSVLLLFFIIFFLRPQTFLRFNTKLLDRLGNEFLYNQSEENLSALARITNHYLEDIVKAASNIKRAPYKRDGEEAKEKDIRALQFIDIELSTPKFVEFIATNNIIFILNFIKLAEKYELWQAGGNIFVDKLSEALFNDENSLLTKELMFGGVSGLQKPISNTLFRSSNFLSHYRVFNIHGFWSSEVSKTALQNWTHALEVAIEHYFSKEQNIYYGGTPNDTLNYSLSHLGECTQSLVYEMNKLSEDKSWGSKYSSKVSVIGRFFEQVVHILVVDDAAAEDKPVFSEQELKVEERTVTEGISKGLFAYLEGIATMKNEKYARMLAMQPYWALFDGRGTPVLQGIRGKLLQLIKERIEENLKDRYYSMIKLLLIIYDGALRDEKKKANEIEQDFSELFRNKLGAQILKDNKFRKEHMPKHWFISKNEKEIWRKIHGREEIIYPVIKKSKTK